MARLSSVLLLFAACGSDTTSHIADSTKSTDSAGSGSGTVGACDINTNATHSCIDYAAGFIGSELQGCTALHGTFTPSGMCDRTGSVGGCLQTFPNIGMMTTWFYPPVAAADVMVTCTDDGNAVFVTP